MMEAKQAVSSCTVAFFDQILLRNIITNIKTNDNNRESEHTFSTTLIRRGGLFGS